MKYSLLIISTLCSFLSFSQDEVKKNTYKGNIFYHDSEFEDAAYYYEKAVTESSFNFKANYNLANTQVRLKEFDKAIETYKKIADYTNTNTKKAKIYHNIGNAQMYLLEQTSKDKQTKASDLLDKLEDAIESYKTALRANSRDEETRYNLAYALLIKKQLEDQQMKEQKSEDKKDSDDNKDSEDKKDGDQSESDDKKDGDKKDGDSKSDKNEDGDQKNEDGDKSDEEKESDKQDEKDSKGDTEKEKPQQQKISSAQAKRILEAAEKAEKEIQNKLNKQKVIVGDKSKSGTKKDW